MPLDTDPDPKQKFTFICLYTFGFRERFLPEGCDLWLNQVFQEAGVYASICQPEHLTGRRACGVCPQDLFAEGAEREECGCLCRGAGAQRAVRCDSCLSCALGDLPLLGY